MEKINAAWMERNSLDDKRPVFVVFSSVRCAPCHNYKLLLARVFLDPQFAGQSALYECDTDLDQVLPSQADVRTLPTLVVYYRGVPRGALVGACREGRVIEFVRAYLPPTT